ncbi:hypothetical protein [Streptomyces erythrochromogenes]
MPSRAVLDGSIAVLGASAQRCAHPPIAKRCVRDEYRVAAPRTSSCG